MNKQLSDIETFINAIPVNIAIYRYVDNDFIFIDFNATAEKTESVFKEELLGKKLTEIFPGVKEFGLFDVLLDVNKNGLEKELDMGFYEDERVSGWRHNTINKLQNGDLIVSYTDKSVEKKLEEELQVKYDELENAQKIAHLGSWTWDMQSNVIAWSDEVFRIFGEKPQSFTPTYERFLSYLNEDDQIGLQEAVDNAIKNKTTYSFEHHVKNNKESISYVEESGSVKYDKSGNPISMIGTILDISKIKGYQLKEEERHEKTKFYQSSLLEWAKVDYNNFEDAIKQATRISAKTLNVSRSSIWLYKDEESRLECISIYLNEEDRYENGAILQSSKYPMYFNALAKDKSLVIHDAQNSEITSEFKEDYLIPLEIYSMLDTPIIQEGKLVGVVCNEHTKRGREWLTEDIDFSTAISNNVSLALEIEKRKISERKVSRLTKLIDNSETIVFYWKAEENWPVEYVSSNITQFGYSQEEFLSGNILYSDIIHPDDKAKVFEEVVSFSNSKEDRFAQVYRILSSDKKIRWIDDRTVIERDENGVPKNYLGTIIDITEYKEVENKLQSLGTIVDESINEIYIFDALTLNFTYLNDAAGKNIGYTLEEMRQINPADIKPDYNKFTFQNLLEPLINDEKEFLTLETVHQRKDFTTYDVEIKLQKMTLDNKTQFVVIAQDISERKRVQYQIQESEEKFRNIAESTLMGVFIYQDKYVYSNEAFANMLGYSIPEIYNLHPWGIMEKDFQEEIKSMVKRRLNGEVFPRIYNDINILTKNKQKKTLRVTTQTINYQGEYAGIGTMIDITDIKKTEEKLQLLGQAIDQMDEMVRITNKNGKITYVNESIVAHSGYKAIELIGSNINIFKSGKHDNAFYKELWATISKGDVFKGIITNKKKDDSLYHEETTITPILNNDGSIQSYVSTSQDITERVLMEKKLHSLATTDSLTGIFNRYKINEEIDSEMVRYKRYDGTFALLMFDIDY